MTKDELIELAQIGMGIHSLNQPEYIVCEALIKALAQPEQEPLAWYRDENGIRIYYESKVWDDAIPLYTTPPQRTWVGLTDEEKHLFSSWLDHKTDDEVFTAIESALRSKND